MALSWNEIKSRATTFSKEWQDESREDAEAKSFWDAFLMYLASRADALPALRSPLKSLTAKVVLSTCCGAANYWLSINHVAEV